MNFWSHTFFTGLPLAATLGIGYQAWRYRRRALRLERAQTEQREEREAVVDMLNRIGLRVNASLDLDGALRIIAEYLVETTRAESGAIFLLDADEQTLRARAIIGNFPPLRPPPDDAPTKQKCQNENIRRDRIEIGEGIIGFVAKTGEALVIADATADARVPKIATDFLQIKSMLVAPLRIHQKILGVVALVNRRDPRETFGDQDLRLTQQLAAQAALTVDVVRLYEHEHKQRRIEQELRVAREFQQLLLPRESPRVSGLDIAAFSTPALELGGDYFDFIWVEKPLFLGIAIVDVSGKGAPAALVMTMLRSALRAAAPGCLSPKQVLRAINRQMLEDTQPGVFITMTYAIIDTKRFLIRFARAGHEPLLVWNENRRDPPHALQPKGIAIGLVPDPAFDVLEEIEMPLEPGDTLALYTDGAVEAANADGQPYGTERFLSSLRRQTVQGANERIQSALEEIERFTGGAPQQDDITLLIVGRPAQI